MKRSLKTADPFVEFWLDPEVSPSDSSVAVDARNLQIVK